MGFKYPGARQAPCLDLHNGFTETAALNPPLGPVSLRHVTSSQRNSEALLSEGYKKCEIWQVSVSLRILTPHRIGVAQDRLVEVKGRSAQKKSMFARYL